MSDNPTYKKVDPRQYHRLGVPMALQQAVRVLNEALKIDAGAVTVALETGAEVKEEALKGFMNHPSIIIRDAPNGKHALAGLGLLNGALMTKRFRLYVEFGDGDQQYKRFGIYEVLSS